MGGKDGDVSGITVEGPYTLRIRLEQPFSPFLYLLSMTAAYVVPREEVERTGNGFAHNPTGTGPYRLREWSHNNRLLLERNEGYFEGRPALAGIAYRIIPDDLTAVTEFELGNLDIIAIPASEYRRFISSAKWKPLVTATPGINTYYLGFNCSRSPFSDPIIRKAVAGAIDRKKILETYYEKRGVLAQGPVPEALRSWSPPLLPAYEPVQAKKALQRSGFKGKPIRFYVTADQEVADIAEIIQSYLRAAGIDVAITQLEWSSYKSALNNGEADMFWISWWADYPDPENFLFPLFHSANHGPSGNRTWYTNHEVDALIEEGQRSSDSAARTRAYAEAERLIVEDAAWVPFWHRAEVTIRQPSVLNFRAYPIYSMDKGTEVSF
jgi:peptide/nickel transport system substrate-binding protein/oligopeptide transport system substrate-binding protein